MFGKRTYGVDFNYVLAFKYSIVLDFRERRWEKMLSARLWLWPNCDTFVRVSKVSKTFILEVLKDLLETLVLLYLSHCVHMLPLATSPYCLTQLSGNVAKDKRMHLKSRELWRSYWSEATRACWEALDMIVTIGPLMLSSPPVARLTQNILFPMWWRTQLQRNVNLAHANFFFNIMTQWFNKTHFLALYGLYSINKLNVCFPIGRDLTPTLVKQTYANIHPNKY